MNRKVLFALAFVPLLAQAQVYRWVDAQGKVHYTQTPPSTDPNAAQFVKPPPMMPAGKGATAASPADKNKALAKIARDLEKANNKTDEARAKAEAQSAQREETCRDARGGMRARNDFGGRTFTMDENGERKYWTPEQEAQARDRLQKQIDDNCG